MATISQSAADQAAAAYGLFHRRAEAIRADRTLSAAGKVSALARAYLPYKRERDEMASAHTLTAASTADRLERDLFGASGLSGADAISYRDAVDRASRLESPEEAKALLNRAVQSGDDLLVRAVGQHVWGMSRSAFGGGWGDAVAAYTAARPGADVKLQELADVRSNALAENLVNAMHFHASAPPELSRYNDSQIEQLADQSYTVDLANIA